VLFRVLVIFLGLGRHPTGARSPHCRLHAGSPVSRVKLVCAQIGVGLAELAMLAILPALLIPSLSGLVHQSYPVAEGLQYGILRFICGAEILPYRFSRRLFSGWEYTAPVALLHGLGFYRCVCQRGGPLVLTV